MRHKHVHVADAEKVRTVLVAVVAFHQMCQIATPHCCCQTGRWLTVVVALAWFSRAVNEFGGEISRQCVLSCLALGAPGIIWECCEDFDVRA